MDDMKDLPEAEIMPSDIVFDCPQCGHNLVVDYRAAGLQVPCPDCGAIIQAPIPDGMQIEDLDSDPGELLQQLLQSRRMLVKTEAAAQQMGDKVVELTEELARCRSTIQTIRARLAALEEANAMITQTHQDVLRSLSDILK
jgi:transcription elongation factor Elf1